MKLRLLCIGRISHRWLRDGADEYANRIERYLPFETIELRESRGGGTHGDMHFGREDEGDRLLRKISSEACTVVLDERGKAMNSEGWSAFLGERMVRSTQDVTMVIGGAYGLSDAVKRRGDLLLSLSPMTLTHQMARLLLLEQTYRALTILRNEPYHNR